MGYASFTSRVRGAVVDAAVPFGYGITSSNPRPRPSRGFEQPQKQLRSLQRRPVIRADINGYGLGLAILPTHADTANVPRVQQPLNCIEHGIERRLDTLALRRKHLIDAAPHFGRVGDAGRHLPADAFFTGHVGHGLALEQSSGESQAARAQRAGVAPSASGRGTAARAGGFTIGAAAWLRLMSGLGHYMFSVASGSVVSRAWNRIKQAGVAAGVPFSICKREVFHGNRRTIEYEVNNFDGQRAEALVKSASAGAGNQVSPHITQPSGCQVVEIHYAHGMSRPNDNRAQIQFWAMAGLWAQILFVVGFLLAGLWQGPRYSVTEHSISDMMAHGAPHANFLLACMALAGALTILFVARSLWPLLRASGASRRAAVGSALLALSIYGLGDLLAPFERVACRLADPGCSGKAHLANLGALVDGIVTLICFPSFIAALFILASAFKRLPAWRSRNRQTFWSGIVFSVLFVGTVASVPVHLGGLVQRLTAAGGAVMVGMLAHATLQISKSADVPAS